MDFHTTLTGGDKRSLRGVNETVTYVLKHPDSLQQLFNCLFDEDEILRLRVSDALEKICQERPDWFSAFVPRLLNEVSQIKQPSVQWHFAQIMSYIHLSKPEKETTLRILTKNLQETNDWIVTNLTLEALAHFVRQGDMTQPTYLSLLRNYENSSYKSVVSRVRKYQKEFERP